MDTLVFGIYPWLFGLIALVLLVAAVEVSYRLGHRQAGRAPPDRILSTTQSTTLQAAILGLLGLLIAFSFSMAQNRFDLQRRLIIDEANAIGTTALRAELLPPHLRARATALLRGYVNTRQPSVDPASIERAIQRAVAIQNQLWAVARSAAQEVKNDAVVKLFVSTLNETIDLHSMRVAGYLYRMHGGLMILLVLVAALAVGVTGYLAGLERHRNLPVVSVMTVVLAVVLTLIVDMEQPQRGLIRASWAPLEEVRRGLGAGPTPEP